MTKIRTRFAPSPTGYIHIGNLRAALFPWLLARQAGGDFILRIEDTDQARFVEGAEAKILETLDWLGIDWDEGPTLSGGEKGDFGPYHQTARREIYLKWAKELIDKGLAYADPYSPEQVQAFREEAKASKKAFLYRDYRPENPPQWQLGMPLRFKVPDVKRYTWHDPIMGKLSAGPEALDDFILIKSDGLPTYNFAHIVDDFEMKITHVVRGSEYVASIPKYLSLYEALEIEPPVLACAPHIMAPAGNKKLGKRDGAKSATEYRDDGILPEAMMSFLASLGWNDGTEQEVFTRDELIAKFSLDRVQRSGARFDEKRLLWMNGHFIRELSLDELYERVSGRSRAHQASPFSSPTPTPSKTASALRESISSESRGAVECSPSADIPAERSLVISSGDSSEECTPEENGGVVDDAKEIAFWPKSAENASETYKKQVLALAQDRLKTLADLPQLTSYFFEEPVVKPELIATNKQLKKISETERKELLQTTHDELSKLDNWTAEEIQNCLNRLLEITGQKPGILFSLIRIATTWAPFSPQLNDTLALLGKERSLRRITNAQTI